MDYLGAFLVVGAVLSGLGQVVKPLVFGPLGARPLGGWRGVYFVTLSLHAPIGGLLVGLSGALPVPDFMGGGLAGSVFWYGAAGLFASSSYKVWKSILEAKGRDFYA